MTLPKQVKQFFNQKVAEFLFSEDPIHEMLRWLLHEFMKAETEAIVGTEKNKQCKERKTYFSGYRTRRFDTRLGTIYLLVPKLRNGGYVPFFLQERKRSESALINLVQEAYVNGVSTRKMERLAKSLGIKPGSKEFHALKRGHDLYDSESKSKNKVKGKGKTKSKGKK